MINRIDKTVAILGAGQLGRMLGEAGIPLGLKFLFLDPGDQVSAHRCGEHLCAAYEDEASLIRIIEEADVVTYEFENVRIAAAEHLGQLLPVYPPPLALRTAQDRLYEKTTFQELGIPTPGFADLFYPDELDATLQRLGVPCVLKTRRFGYDGKGQAVIRDMTERAAAFEKLQGAPLLLEEFIPFDRELSMIAVRGIDGVCRFYPLVENHHREGILRLTIAPAAGVSPEVQQQAEKHVRALMDHLGYVGVLAVEFFEKQGRLYANEMAPRVHNSGHWSIEGATTSQFENHMRAVCGAELGETECPVHSAMINLIGEIPEAAVYEGMDGVVLHDYEKSPRPGRKVGHLTVTGNCPGDVEEKVRLIAARMKNPHLDDTIRVAFG